MFYKWLEWHIKDCFFNVSGDTFLIASSGSDVMYLSQCFDELCRRI